MPHQAYPCCNVGDICLVGCSVQDPDCETICDEHDLSGCSDDDLEDKFPLNEKSTQKVDIRSKLQIENSN